MYKSIESLDRVQWVRSQLSDEDRDLWLCADHYALSYGEIIDGAPDLGLPGVAQLYPDTDWNPNQLAGRLHRLRHRIERLGHYYDDPELRR